MELRYKAALSKCNQFIKKTITNIGDVMDRLLQDDCITWDERIRIGQEKSTEEQCQILMETLIKRGGKCYHSFQEALAGSGNNHVMNEIKNAEEKLTAINGDKIVADSIHEENEIGTLKVRITELEDMLKKKKDDLFKLQYEQKRALEDLKRLREKTSNREGDIRPLEKKNRDLEKEIDHLKEIVDYWEKQVSLKDDALKRTEEEKRTLETEHIKAIQNLERRNEQMEKKQIQTLNICEKMAENVNALTIAVADLQNNTKQKQNENVRPNMRQIGQIRPRAVLNKIPNCNIHNALSTFASKQKKGN